MAGTEPGLLEPHALPMEQELALLRNGRRRNQRYMRLFLLACFVAYFGALGLAAFLIREVQDNVAELKRQLRTATEDLEKAKASLATVSTQVETLRTDTTAYASAVKKSNERIESLVAHSNQLNAKLDQQADAQNALSDTLKGIGNESTRVSNDLKTTRSSIETLGDDVKGIRDSLKESKEVLRDLNKARQSLDEAVFESGSYVIKEKRRTLIVLGPEKTASRFFIELGTIRGDTLRQLSIVDTSERPLTKARDVKLGESITFFDDQYAFTIKVRYINEQFFTKDTAGVDIERRGTGSLSPSRSGT